MYGQEEEATEAAPPLPPAAAIALPAPQPTLELHSNVLHSPHWLHVSLEEQPQEDLSNVMVMNARRFRIVLIGDPLEGSECSFLYHIQMYF